LSARALGLRLRPVLAMVLSGFVLFSAGIGHMRLKLCQAQKKARDQSPSLIAVCRLAEGRWCGFGRRAIGVPVDPGRRMARQRCSP
jgi:hypothetical protein